MITSLLTYVLNISIHVIFKKDTTLLKKNNIVWSDSYDEYGWSCIHCCDDTKDR